MKCDQNLSEKNIDKVGETRSREDIMWCGRKDSVGTSRAFSFRQMRWRGGTQQGGPRRKAAKMPAKNLGISDRGPWSLAICVPDRRKGLRDTGGRGPLKMRKHGKSTIPTNYGEKQGT